MLGLGRCRWRRLISGLFCGLLLDDFVVIVFDGGKESSFGFSGLLVLFELVPKLMGLRPCIVLGISELSPGSFKFFKRSSSSSR